MSGPASPRWMLPVAYVAFGLGAVLAAITLLQLITDVRLLDDPLTGMIGAWLLAFVVYGLAKRGSQHRE